MVLLLERAARKMLKQNLILLMFFSSIIVTVVLGTCSTACVSCTNDTCMKCDVGSYLETGSCYTCPERCTSCNNSDVCYNCTEGYYGLSCDKNCNSSMCLNNTCDKDSGACLHGCIEGHYPYGSSCYSCAPYCKTCANFSNNCLECKEGYYGPSCQYPCSHCKDSICSRDNCTYGCGDGFFRGSGACTTCNTNCTRCLFYNNCTACVEGHFGPVCRSKCRDCSPCSQDGSCPKTTPQPPAPTITSNPSLPSTPQSARPTYVLFTIHQSYFPTTSDSSNEGRYQQKQRLDNTIKYAVGGGVGGLFFIVMIVVVVFITMRWSRIKQTNVRINSQVREREVGEDYTTLEMSTRKEDGHLYSDLDNTNTTVSMETTSTVRDSSGQTTQHALSERQICDTGPGIYNNVN